MQEHFYESGSCVQKNCASLGVHPTAWVHPRCKAGPPPGGHFRRRSPHSLRAQACFGGAAATLLRHRRSGFSLAHLCHAGVQLRQELVDIVLEYTESFLETQSFFLAAHLLEASGCGGCLGSREIGEHAPQGVGSGSDAVSISRFHRSAQGKKLPRKILFEDRKKVAERFTIVLDAREQFLMIKNQRSQFFFPFLGGLPHSGPCILCQPKSTPMPLVTIVRSSNRWRSESSRMVKIAMLGLRRLRGNHDAPRQREHLRFFRQGSSEGKITEDANQKGCVSGRQRILRPFNKDGKLR